MLETFYNSFGFVGSIAIAFFAFVLFIFWIAGISGLIQAPGNGPNTVYLVACILFPPYPILWLFYDMYRQKRLMEKTDV